VQRATVATQPTQLASHDVLVITERGCGWCALTLRWLQQRGIPYTEVDVERDPAGARAFLERHGRITTPAVEIDGRAVFGYNPGQMGALLGS